jgi:hypothetical protein
MLIQICNISFFIIDWQNCIFIGSLNLLKAPILKLELFKVLYSEELRGMSSVRKWLKGENNGLWKFLVIKWHDFISRCFFFQWHNFWRLIFLISLQKMK